jgi:hypothetical protein
MKRWLIAAGGGLLVLTLVLTATGTPVFAQDDPATEATEEDDLDFREAYMEALATELGVTVEELETAMQNAQMAMIDRWAEDAKDRIESGDSVFPNFGGDFGFGIAGGMPVRERIPGGMIEPGVSIVVERGGFGLDLADTAVFLGITEEQLRDDLRSGMTLVEIAEANGKTSDELRTYLIEQATERIDEQLEQSAGDTEDAEATPETSA